MADSYIAIDEPSTIDKKADTEQLTVGANTVERERIEIAGAAAAEIARVINTAPTTEYGLVTRNIPSGTQPVSATDLDIRNLVAATDIVDLGGNALTALQLIDDIVHALNGALNKAVAIAGQLDDTTPTAATEDNVAPLRITAQRAAHVNLRDVSGTEIGTAGAPVRTDPTGATTQPVSGTVTANLAAGTNNIGDVDILTLPALPAGTNNIGDVDVLSLPPLPAGTNNIGTVELSATALAALETITVAQVTAAIPTGDNNIGNVDIVTMPNVTLAAGTNTNEVVGDAAHDAAAAGNPLLVGAYAETPDDSAPGNQVSAEADVVRIAADRDGALYTHPHPPRIWNSSGAGVEFTTQQTDATLKAAPGAGLSLYITDIYLACSAAVTVSLEEGTATLKWRYYASGQGDGVAMSFTTPIKFVANAALALTTSAAVTISILVSGYTAP